MEAEDPSEARIVYKSDDGSTRVVRGSLNLKEGLAVIVRRDEVIYVPMHRVMNFTEPRSASTFGGGK